MNNIYSQERERERARARERERDRHRQRGGAGEGREGGREGESENEEGLMILYSAVPHECRLCAKSTRLSFRALSHLPLHLPLQSQVPHEGGFGVEYSVQKRFIEESS